MTLLPSHFGSGMESAIALAESFYAKKMYKESLQEYEKILSLRDEKFDRKNIWKIYEGIFNLLLVLGDYEKQKKIIFKYLDFLLEEKQASKALKWIEANIHNENKNIYLIIYQCKFFILQNNHKQIDTYFAKITNSKSYLQKYFKLSHSEIDNVFEDLFSFIKDYYLDSTLSLLVREYCLRYYLEQIKSHPDNWKKGERLERFLNYALESIYLNPLKIQTYLLISKIYCYENCYHQALQWFELLKAQITKQKMIDKVFMREVNDFSRELEALSLNQEKWSEYLVKEVTEISLETSIIKSIDLGRDLFISNDLKKKEIIEREREGLKTKSNRSIGLSYGEKTSYNRFELVLKKQISEMDTAYLEENYSEVVSMLVSMNLNQEALEILNTVSFGKETVNKFPEDEAILKKYLEWLYLKIYVLYKLNETSDALGLCSWTIQCAEINEEEKDVFIKLEKHLKDKGNLID